jgi:hypothetical protein
MDPDPAPDPAPDPTLDPDLDPTPDPTPLFRDFKDAKNLIFSPFFSYNLPTGTLSSVLKNNFFAQILC